MSEEIVQWADPAMFEAAPMQRDERGRVTPLVSLLSATPDPLGVNAAGFRMYGGVPTYDLAQIPDDGKWGRRWAWEESLNTHLAAPWEFIDFHFFIEGVTRAFTHQMVRQRTAVYAQESLRFAVKEGFAQEVPLPPSITDKDEVAVKIWSDAVQAMEDAYTQLVNAGIPAEDARGLLPHCVTTRLHYKTNFRNLVEHAGNRLCTQAQFEWRSVFLQIMVAIKRYDSGVYRSKEKPTWRGSGWQFEELAAPLPKTFTPVCYKAGKCVFMGDLDRKCTIRERVNSFAEAGVPAADWHHRKIVTDRDGQDTGQRIEGINPMEWMADHTAAR